MPGRGSPQVPFARRGRRPRPVIPQTVTRHSASSDDRPAHLGRAVHPLHEGDRHLDHPEPGAQGPYRQVDLEAVPLGLHLVEGDRAQRLRPVGAVAAGGVLELDPEHYPGVGVSAARQQLPRLRPVARPCRREPSATRAPGRRRPARPAGPAVPPAGASRRRPSRPARRSPRRAPGGNPRCRRRRGPPSRSGAARGCGCLRRRACRRSRPCRPGCCRPPPARRHPGTARRIRPADRLDVGALVVGGHDHGNAPRGLPAGLHAAQDSLPARCLSPPRGGTRLPSLPVDVPAGYRVPWPRWPAGVLAAEGTCRKEGPGRPSDRSPPRRSRDRPRCLLSARALPSPAICQPGMAPRMASPVLDLAVT